MKRKESVVILSDEEGMVSWLGSAERGVSESSLQWADGNRLKLGGCGGGEGSPAKKDLLLVMKVCFW